MKEKHSMQCEQQKKQHNPTQKHYKVFTQWRRQNTKEEKDEKNFSMERDAHIDNTTQSKI